MKIDAVGQDFFAQNRLIVRLGEKTLVPEILQLRTIGDYSKAVIAWIV